MTIFARAVEQKKDAEQLLVIEQLLQKLAHHHIGQAKPDSTPVSREYSAKLASELRAVLGWKEPRYGP